MQTENSFLTLCHKTETTMTQIRKAWKRHTAKCDTYVIVYCIPPEYEVEYTVEKTGTYAYVRSCALTMASSGHCIILDIRVKEK